MFVCVHKKKLFILVKSQSSKMAKMIVNAARAATQIAAWSDSEDSISDEEDTVESEDSEDDIDQPLIEECDIVTDESMNYSLLATANIYRQVWKIYCLTHFLHSEGSDEEGSPSSRPDDLMAKTSFKGRNDHE